MAPTALFRFYRATSSLALPFVARRAVNKLRDGGVPVHRAHERLGHATGQRPGGPLIWFHGASVGEAKSVLPLIAQMRRTRPEAPVLLTSGTATSAEAVAGHLPAGVQHQFAPLDAPGPLARFLRHWRPDLCVLVESELWPNLLDTCAKAELPVALLNARLSDKSAEGWKKFPETTRYILRGLTMALCQDARTRQHLREMGVDSAQHGANLKALITTPTPPAAALSAARTALGRGPLWVAASTHAGEEAAVLEAHAQALRTHPDLCLILVPRHPDRGAEIAGLIETHGLRHARRSTGGALAADVQVYLADTMGETPLWYALAPIVFLGGSFTDVGGHTPFEPAAAQCAILHGPHYANFAEAYAQFRARGASVEVETAAALGTAVTALLDAPERAEALARRARPLVQDGTAVLQDLAERLYALAHAHARGPDD